MKHLKTFENFEVVNEELFGLSKKEKFFKSYEELKNGTFIRFGNTTDGTARQVGIPEKADKLKGSVSYTGGLKLSSKYKDEEQFLSEVEADKYEGRIDVDPVNKTFGYTKGDVINRRTSSATSAGLNTGAGGVGDARPGLPKLDDKTKDKKKKDDGSDKESDKK